MLGKRKRNYSARRNVRRKRTVRKRRPMRRRRRGRSSIRRSIPDYTMVALPFSETREMTQLNAHPGTTLYSYRLNSMYDPYTPTTVGGQPLGFDQYGAFFQKYRVHAVKYHIRFFEPSAVNGSELRVGTYVGPDATQIPAGQQFSIFRELPNARSKVLSVAPGSTWSTSMSGFQKLYRLQGISRTDYNGDDDFEARYGENPIKSPQLYLYAWNPTDPVDNASLSYEIRLVYYATLFKRKPLVQS